MVTTGAMMNKVEQHTDEAIRETILADDKDADSVIWTIEDWSCEDATGKSAAHRAVELDISVYDPARLDIIDGSGFSVASAMIQAGILIPVDHPSMYTVNKDGTTTAHIYCKVGMALEDPALLALKDAEGVTVAEYMRMYGQHP